MTKLGKRGTIASGYLCALLATTALTSPLLLAAPAAAAGYIGTGGGDGHDASNFGSGGAGAGGAGGTNGSGGTAPGGGGGGGYSGGYPGGGGGSADNGGGGGTYYGNAGSAGGGGAGGYGYLLTDGSTFTSSGDIIGGKGGNGGAGLSDYAQNSAGGGGGGGGGGSGIIVQGAGTINNTNTITGGDGGNAGGTAAFYLDAHPGAGGFGIRADNSTGVTITNSGNITGGSQGGSLSPNVVNIAGAGIYGQNITLYNTGGSIAGGVADLSVAAAIELTGGTNALNLSGGTIQSFYSGDGIRTDAGTNTIVLNGATINLAQSGAGLNIVGGANTLTFSSGSIAMGQEATGLQVGGGTGNIFNLSGGSIAPSYDNNSHTYHFYNYGIVVNGGSSTFNISAGTVAAGGGTTGIENSAVLLTSGTNVFNISGTANISNAAYSDLVDITGGTNTFNISGGSIVHANQGYTWSIKVSGGTNILNVTGGTLDPIYLGGGTNTLEGSGFSNSVTLASGAIAKVIAAGTDVAGITSFDNSGTLTVEDGRSISMTSFTNENGGALNLGTGSQLIATSLNLIAGSTITGAGSLSSGSSAYSLDSGSISASLAGSGGLTKTGSGILTLTGANTYTGGTNINGGTLSIAAGALGGGDVHMAQGTTIRFTGSSFTTHNNFFIDGDPVFDVASATVQTIDGVIADDPGGAPGIVEKTGAGTLVLSGANTYSGGTTVTAGTLTMGSNTALGTGAVTLDGGTLSPSGAVFSNQIVVNGTGGTIDGASGGTISGAIVDGTGGLGTLTFSGGTILLSGSNSYASATTVSAGATLDAYQGLSVNSDYTVNGHLRLDGSGGFFTVKSLSGTGDITSFGSGTVLFISPASGQTATFDGTLSNGSNPFVNVLQLNFNGAGTQKITGANSYSGGTIITSGTLEIGNASALGTGAISFYAGTLKTDGAYTIANAITMSAAGGTIDSGGFNTTLSGAIADGTASGLLTLAGGGTFTLSGNNTSTGGLSLASGTLVTGGNGMGSGRITLGNGTTVKAADTFSHDNAITLAGGATLDVDGHQVTLNGVISDAVGTHGSLTLKDSIGNYNSDFLVLSGANTYSGGTTIAGLMTVYAQNDSAFGTGAVSVDNAFIKHGGSNLTLANDISIGNQLSVNADSGIITLNGVISESLPQGMLYLNGNVVVNGANTYSGGTTIANNVTAGNNDAFGSGEIFLYGTLQAAGGSALTIDNAMDLNGTGTVLGNGTTLTLSGEIFDDFSGPAALVIGAGGAADASTVVLSGDNSFTGGLTIAGGTVKAASSTALGDSGGTVTMNDGTALAYANGVDIANTLNFTGSAALSVASGDRATQSGDIGDDAPANPHTVTKTGAGTLVLSGTNNSSANVKLSMGTLEIGSQNALGNGTYTFDGGTLRLDGGWTIGNDVRVLSGGTLDTNGNDIELSGDVSSDSTDGVLTLAGTGSVKISNYNNLSGGAAIDAGTTLEVAGASGMGAGDVSMALGSTVKFTAVSSAFTNHFLLDGYSNFNVASGLTTTLSGVIADAPATTGTLVNAGAGTLVLSGANIYSGGTSLSDGILQIGIDTVGTPGNITSSAVGTGTISFHGGTMQAGGDYTVANAISLASGDGTVDANGHAFALTGIIGGSHVLTFTDSQGGGTITLSGANTYNGGTTIRSGVTALAGGDQAFGQSTIVLDGGTLGAVAGTTVSSGNTIAVGSVGGTILANGGTLNLSGTIVDVDPGNGGWLTLGKAGETGTIAISGTNIYAGGTIIAGGTVKVSGSSALGAGAIEMAGGTTLALTSGASLGNMLIVDDTTPTLNVASGTATLSGGISELSSASGGFAKTGSGTLVLTGSSGNSGITNVSAGTLEIGDGAAASSSAYQVGQGATLSFDAQSLNYAQIGSLAGAGNVTSATLLDIGNSDNTTFSGVITTAGLNYNGSGILTLTGTGNHLGGVSICGCVTSGGITLSGGNANASSGVGVESGTFTATAGAQFGTTRIVQGGGTIAISGNGTAVGATNIGVGIIGVYADGSTAPVFTVSDGAHVTSDFLMAGIAGGTVAPQIAVTGANALLSLTNGVQLNDGTVLTVADGATLATGSVDLDTNASLVIGAGAAAGTVGDANTRIQGLSSGTSVVANFTGGATLDALLTGSVALNVQAGNLTLTNTLNDYGGGSTIAAGAALTIQNNAVGTGSILDNGTLVLDNNAAVTMANGISGSGGVTQNGAGALTFDAAKTYSGRTVIGPASTLFLTGAGDLSLSSAVAAHGTFDVSGVTATNVSVQALDGDGDVEIGNRTLVITGSGGLYSGMLSDGHAGGSLTLLGNQVLNGILSITGTTTLGAGSTLTVSGPDALGGGALKFLADSTLKFRGSGTYTNAMDFAVGAPLFDVTGQTVALSGAIGGPGDLAVTGNGTLILTNTANSYGGGTEVTGGATLKVDADGELGATASTLQLGDATTAGTLRFGGAFSLNAARSIVLGAGGGVIDTNGNDITIGQAISGGGLTKAGAGNLILTGTSSFSGPTVINAGTLSVNGAIASSAVRVNSGATLGGTGTVGATTVASGGALAPGNSIGTLHVNGGLTFAGGSTYAADISPGTGTADSIAATGAASLGGTLAITQGAGTYTGGTDLTLLSASGVSGTFDSVTGASFTGLDSAIVYSATSVSLKLSSPGSNSSSGSGNGGGAPATLFLFNTYGTTPNQIAAGTALAAGASTGKLYTAMGGVVSANTAGVATALGQAAGDIHASIRGAAIEDSRIIRNTVLGRLDQGGDGVVVWGSAFGGYGSIAGDGNAAALHHDSAGIIAGADMPLSDGIRAGIAAAYSTDRAATTGHLGTTSSGNGHIIGYAGWSGGAFDVRLGGDYGWGTAHIARQLGALGQTLAGRQDQQMGQVFADAGYRITGEHVVFEPYADIAHVEATSGSFAESGGSAALSGGSATDGVTYGTLGARASFAGISLQDVGIAPKIDLGWRHAFDVPKPGQAVSFQDTGTGFTVLGVPLESDAAALQLGFDVTLAPGARLSLGYDGTFGSRVQNNAVRGAFQWRF